MAATYIPRSVIINQNGTISIIWWNTIAEANVSDFQNFAEGTDPYYLPLQINYPLMADQGICPFDSTQEKRGKMVGSPGNGETTRASFSGSTTTAEQSIAVPVSLTGDSIKLNTPHYASPAAQVSSIVRFNADADKNNVSQAGWTLSGATFENRYIGPTTDIRLTNVAATSNAVPKIDSDSGSGSTTTVTFEWSNARRGRLKSGRPLTDIKLNVNGVPFNCTSASTLATVQTLVFSIPTSPTDVLTLTYPDGTFELTTVQASATGLLFDCVPAVALAVTNNRAWPQPTYVSASPASTGTQIRLNMSQTLGAVTSPGNLTFTGNYGGSRTGVYQGVNGQSLVYNITGQPIYRGESLSGFSQVPAGVVRTVGSSASQGLNAAFTPNNFTVNTSDTGAALAPIPTLQSATIAANGTQLTLVWDRAATRATTTALLAPTWSPVGNQTLGNPTSGNSTTTWVYNLNANAIRIGDIVKITAASTYANDTVSGQACNPFTNFPVTNNSTIPYPKPLFTPATSRVNASGQNVRLVFDRAVVIGASFVTAVKVLAKDISSATVRVFTPVAGTPVLGTTTIANDTVSFDVVGAGTIFGNNIGGLGAPNDGDTVAVNTNNTAGIVISKLSSDAGQPSLLDPIGTVTSIGDYPNSIPISNISAVQEPVTDVIPVYEEAEIYNSGSDQFLRIRFDNGSGTSVKVQDNHVFPVLVTTLAGPIPLAFYTIQAGTGDNDTIVYRMTGVQVKRAADGEICTLTVTAAAVVSDATGDPNVVAGPFVSGTNNFVNNSTVAQPVDAPLPPVAQQVIIGIDGLKVGVYYDTPIYAVAGSIEVNSLLTGSKLADFTGAPAQNTLLTSTVAPTVVPIFRGEYVEVTLPESLVSSVATGQLSLEQDLVAINNSLIPYPRSPVLDSVVLNDPGTLLIATYDVPVVAGAGLGYTLSDKSGRNNVTILSIASNIVSIDVAGIDYEGETVDLYLERDFVKEAKYGVVSSDAVNKLTVNVAGRTSAAPDLPANSTGLTSEVL